SLNVLSQYKAKIELNEGVKAYENGEYLKAQEHFENSFSENPAYTKAIFNAGNAAYLNGDFEAARDFYNKYIGSKENKFERAEALHNIGNSYLKNFKEKKDENSLIESINYFKKSLRENPNDQETRYNLAYALNQLQQNKEDNQQQDENKDQDKKDQDKKDQDKKDQEQKDQEQKDQEQKKDNEEGKDDKEKEEEKKGEMSKKQIEKNLDDINNEEEKILLKVNRQKGDKKKTTNQVKDW
ncbi:MAG: hypothetical protein P8M12_04985, partial [Flavobacteriales bacterium]|nr:hypothetical protein [Flavobacteriales bacterium]